MASQGGVEALRFLDQETIVRISQTHTLPLFVYSEAEIVGQVQQIKNFPVNSGDGFGFTARFAMKANPSRAVLRILLRHGIKIDASSEYEVHRALAAGYAPGDIQLTAQELSPNLGALVEKGVHFTACSVRQLEAYGKLFPGTELAVRFNPGTGSGHCVKANVGGAHSSFGVWHEQVDQVKVLASKHNLKIGTVHTHIGSGSDPMVWQSVATVTLGIAAQFPDCHTVNLGGGFKIERMSGVGPDADLQAIGAPIKELFANFHSKHGRALHLEIEPGSFYMVRAGSLLCRVDDMVDTGAKGHRFLKLSAGMDSITRPSLYGARHPIVIVPHDGRGECDGVAEFVVSGHCCETGDLFTQAAGGDPEPRPLRSDVRVGDFAVIEGAGAYCSSMCTKNYNSFPELEEVMILADGSIRVIRVRQTLEQIVQNEREVPELED